MGVVFVGEEVSGGVMLCERFNVWGVGRFDLEWFLFIWGFSSGVGFIRSGDFRIFVCVVFRMIL